MLTDIGTQHRVFVMDASQLLAELEKDMARSLYCRGSNEPILPKSGEHKRTAAEHQHIKTRIFGHKYTFRLESRLRRTLIYT
jgi:hypothetical protein